MPTRPVSPRLSPSRPLPARAPASGGRSSEPTRTENADTFVPHRELSRLDKVADRLDAGLERGVQLVQRQLERARGYVRPPVYPTVERHSPEFQRKLEKLYEDYLAQLPDDQRAVLSAIFDTKVNAFDLWQGSHIVFEDQGDLYERWRSLGAAEKRSSSHYRDVDVQQFELDLPPFGALLFGKEGEGRTWVQLEAHQVVGDRSELVLHVFDYFRHKAFDDANVGPLGISPRSEKRGTEVIVTKNQLADVLGER